MNKIKKALKILAIFVLINPNFSNNLDYITKSNFNNIVSKNNAKSFIYVSSWCGMCKQELVKLNTNLPKNTIIVMFPYILENGKKVNYLNETKEYVKENKFKFKIYYDTNLYLYKLYDIKSVPSEFKIQKENLKWVVIRLKRIV